MLAMSLVLDGTPKTQLHKQLAGCKNVRAQSQNHWHFVEGYYDHCHYHYQDYYR